MVGLASFILVLLIPPSITAASPSSPPEASPPAASPDDSPDASPDVVSPALATSAVFDTAKEGRLQPTAFFSDTMAETDPEDVEVVEGTVPGWLAGTMYKVGVGAFSVGDRKVNNVLDALSKIYRWTFTPGSKTSFAGKFLKTGIYNKSVEAGSLFPHRVVGDITPPISALEKIKMLLWDDKRDNNNITPWKLKGRDGITVTGESPIYFDVDSSSLDPLEKYTFVEHGKLVKEFMSASHFARHPSTGDSFNYVYIAGLDGGVFTGVEPGYQMVRIRGGDGEKARAEVVGHVTVPLTDMRVVHSIGVTENYVVLPRFSLKIDLNSTTHVCSNVKFDPTAPTTFHVMTLKDGKYKTFVFPAFISVHIANSFERINEKGETEVVADFPVLTTTHDFPNGKHCYYEILNMDYMLNDDFLYSKEFRPLTDITIRRFIMNMDTGASRLQEFPQNWVPIQIHIDFPFVNDNYRGVPYCIVYFHTIQWDNRNAMGILKLNLCEKTSASWDTMNLFPVEPVFVQKPGSTVEDEGVLLAPVYNAITDTSELYIWDARDLHVLARLSTPMRVPWTNHGIWEPTEEGARKGRDAAKKQRDEL